MAYDLKGFGKNITVGSLRRVLADLDDDLVLVPNLVGNLSVVRGAEYHGFIDISTEAFDRNDPPWAMTK